jgi:RNA polymerase sigma-70 factor (ECF subfamily)
LNAQDILALMKQLNEMQRTVFNLYEIDGYAHKEIGSMLNIPESSSRTYLTRAKQALQQLLITHSIHTK